MVNVNDMLKIRNMWLYYLHLLETKPNSKTWTLDEDWTFTTNWDALISNLYDPSR
jgi:hypothetical protein